MMKYTFGALAIMAAIVAAAFLVLAELNNHDAEAGPAPIYEITATDDGITPARLEVDRNRVVELRLVNHASRERALTLKSNDVEQLPAQAGGRSQRGATQPLSDIDVSVPANGSGFALVRFKQAGTYELKVGPITRPATFHTLTVEAR